MNLGELITALEAADPEHIAPIGFADARSWRGDYQMVAFEPATNVTVGSMLAHARSALNATFHGYKGGEYVMGEWVDCYIDRYGEASGDRIGPVLVAYMTGKVEAKQRGGEA